MPLCLCCYSSRSRHTRWVSAWSSAVCSSDLAATSARTRSSTSNLRSEQLRELEVLDRVRAEVAAAYARTHARFAEVETGGVGRGSGRARAGRPGRSGRGRETQDEVEDKRQED